jgi:hypothetical protein
VHEAECAAAAEPRGLPDVAVPVDAAATVPSPAVDAQAATGEGRGVSVDGHDPGGSEQLLEAVLPRVEIAFRVAGALHPRRRRHPRVDLDPQPPDALSGIPAGQQVRNVGVGDAAVEDDPPAGERLEALEPQRPGAEHPGASVPVEHGVGRFGRPGHQNPAARPLEVEQDAAGRLPCRANPLDHDPREAEAASVVPDERRRALAEEGRGRALRRDLVDRRVHAAG